jgi:DHA2 family methylenomycin A resistance protein-like MFS transporter
LTFLTTGLIESRHAHIAIPALAAWVPASLLFIAIERRSQDPMLPLSLLRSRTFSGATFVGLAINLGFYGQLFALSLYFQHVRGFSALSTGLALLPEGVFVALASTASGRVTARWGPRRPMLGGLICGAAGFLGLAAAGATTSYGLLVLPLVAAGAGMAFTMPAATAAVIDAAPANRAGIASGVLNAARQAGGAIGVALLGTLLAHGSFISGLHAAMAVSAGSFLTAAGVTALAVRGERGGVRHHGRR